jgi:hypothetical protein
MTYPTDDDTPFCNDFDDEPEPMEWDQSDYGRACRLTDAELATVDVDDVEGPDDEDDDGPTLVTFSYTDRAGEDRTLCLTERQIQSAPSEFMHAWESYSVAGAMCWAEDRAERAYFHGGS